MNYLKESKKELVKGAINKHPNNMAAAARYVNISLSTLKYIAKQLGIYAPNQGQRDGRLEHQRILGWDDCSIAEKRRRVLSEQASACLTCELTHWLGSDIPLELDHIDGNNCNDSRDNLRFLCPNCHTLTETYRGKNIDNTSSKIKDSDIIDILKRNKNITNRQLLISLDLTPKGGNYARINLLRDGLISG